MREPARRAGNLATIVQCTLGPWLCVPGFHRVCPYFPCTKKLGQGIYYGAQLST